MSNTHLFVLFMYIARFICPKKTWSCWRTSFFASNQKLFKIWLDGRKAGHL